MKFTSRHTSMDVTTEKIKKIKKKNIKQLPKISKGIYQRTTATTDKMYAYSIIF